MHKRSLEFEDEGNYDSVINTIFKSHGMYFFQGTDVDDSGPYMSIEDAIDDVEYFDIERGPGFVAINAEGVPKKLLNRVIRANAQQPGIKVTLNGQPVAF